MGILKRLGYAGLVVGTGGAGAAAKYAVMGTEKGRQRKKMLKLQEQQNAMMSGSFITEAEAQRLTEQQQAGWADTP